MPRGRRPHSTMTQEAKDRNRRDAYEFLPGDLVMVDKTDSWGWKGLSKITQVPLNSGSHRFKPIGSKYQFSAKRGEIRLLKAKV